MGQPAKAVEQARRLHLRHLLLQLLLLLHLRLVRHNFLLAEGRNPLRGPGVGHKPVQHRERLFRGLPRPRHQLLEAEQAVAPPPHPLLRAC